MKHISVLLNEAVDALNINKDGIYVDATLGGGGHSNLILSKLKKGHLYAFDQDQFAIDKAGEKLKDYSNKTFIHSNFKLIKGELLKRGISSVDGILFDLGLSSFQIDDETRGFSYLRNYKLDMRMDKRQSLTAEKIVNTYDKEDLARIFREYGDEKNAWKIALEIESRRPLKTTFDLVKITDKINRNVKGHSAKRVFQALRIEVNGEMDSLKLALEETINLLKPGGRLVVISFHSLEDRIVKQFIKKHSVIDLPKSIDIRGVDLPPLKVITRKALTPSKEELELNKRSKSALLRIAERQ